MISIMVPIYNAENYIRQCIESILNQTYTDWELILIDNGSTDGSFDICQQYAKQDMHIRLLRQHHNQGVSAARNLGVQKARGAFITFIDADDWVREDYLDTLTDLQKEQKSDMVICEYIKVYDKDRNKSGQKVLVNDKEPKTQQVKVYMLEQYIEEYLLEGNTHCWGVLYEKNLLDLTAFPKGMSIGEDLLFLLEAALKAKKIVVTDYSGYRYYMNENGAMNKKFTTSYMDQIRCWHRATETIAEIYPRMEDKLHSILVVSALLIAGKLSELTKEEQKQYKNELKQCLSIVKQYGSNKKVRKYLPQGYPFKVMLFGYAPRLYLKLYGNLKRRD